MKKEMILILMIVSAFALLLMGCQKEQIIGGDKDEHGCLIAAGYSWCDAKEKCMRPWEENCTIECGETCPLLSQPAPSFCTDGTIVEQGKDSCGCQLPPKCLRACTEEAKICPDGSAVGRNSENNCEFDPCPTTQIANPASKFCVDNGGTLEIVTAADGSQSGVCTLADGVTKCDEWAYFRGECPEEKEPEIGRVYCTEEQKAAEICTMEYMPVCGDDGVTYGNKCSACASKKIDSYSSGECAKKECPIEEVICQEGTVTVAYTGDDGCQHYKCPMINQCTAEQKAAEMCTKEYMPVCGWFNQSIQCVKYPCAATYGNKCTACSDGKVAYWTEGECPE